ncbi:[NiFe]-hydrogenase assembly, chaperone, HybE [Rhodobacteraceae bacterium CCMM004]|nr:[NiFe]-hydrogenase assembly, chaperone, HybE [Rhodobacteraceae bacterium CCMM004]
MSGFEGSYLGKTAAISDAAVMECKICWTAYDPAAGDPHRQVLPGTPFSALPEDWSCPTCDAPAEQFLVLADPGATGLAEDAAKEAAVAALVADFTEVYHAKMRDVPLVNKALHVEAVGFRAHGDGWLGVLLSPWFMNLVLLPGPAQDWSTLTPGAKQTLAFPSGDYEFLHNVRETVGGYKACSLFSPMDQFASQMKAVEVARAVMAALFDPAHRDDTDRAADIRVAREDEIAAAEAAALAAEGASPTLSAAPTRRAVISGGMAGGEV